MYKKHVRPISYVTGDEIVVIEGIFIDDGSIRHVRDRPNVLFVHEAYLVRDGRERGNLSVRRAGATRVDITTSIRRAGATQVDITTSVRRVCAVS